MTPTTGTLRWGVLGLGRIAGRFAQDLPNSRTGTLVAVASRDLARAKSFADQYDAERPYGDYDELLADDSVDAVYVATPHPSHARWAVRAAQAGKHVLCEKPLTVNHAEAMAVIEAARDHDVFAMEAYMYRCRPQTARLAELVRSGAIGAVHQIQASFAFASNGDPANRLFRQDLAGGGILDVGGYPVSMVRLLAGAARGEAFADPDGVEGVGHLGPDNRIDEWAVATLRFAPSGSTPSITAQVATGVRQSAENVVRVFGSHGYLVVASPWGSRRDGTPTTIEVHRVGSAAEIVEFGPDRSYALEADAVADHLDDRQAPAMSWADTLGNMATLDRWRAAIGLEYDAERADAAIPTVHGRPVTARPDHRMRYGEVPGVRKQVSRLVLGSVGRGLPHASVMYDDFVERGGNCFDTAYHYGGGRAERLLGQWMRNRGNREEVVVIGKGAHTPHCDPESIRSQLTESLERLRTDYIDLYFMHRDNTDIPVGEFVDVLDELHRAGRIHAYGGSNWTTERLDEANAYAQSHGRKAFVALSNNFSQARMVEPPWAGCLAASDPATREWLERQRLALFPWSSQARGFFTDRSAHDDLSDPELARCWYSEDNFLRKERAQTLARRRGVSAVAIALAYVLAQEFPTFPLIGPQQLSETRDSFAALDVELSPEEVRWLDLRD
ncbi:aldo/keto reductase [Actinopolymorpha pittospori]|uniref:Dehydrogenase/aryl-alcohol dehydrogenase-like putative oxidoreductase n=1 Tax=Actinopolymorpha pittospori TaxID=648752 RepID=A0A927MPS4_9ACTN|nr:aldo/keto reductase [Actinopolymorpha pittospori]MBE1604626.1 putative dehydrogenase/aryl-alcohol dehydrogenase-like putative oxidoreductase [Actinopolymorpha pittospori]